MRELTPQERRDIALTIAGEIDPRYSPYGTEDNRREIAAILGVIENRFTINKPRQFSNTTLKHYSSLSDVVLQPSQFSTWNTADAKRIARYNYGKFRPAIDKAVDDYFTGYLQSPVPDATHYWAPAAVLADTGSPEPYWAPDIRDKTRIGAQVFGFDKRIPPAKLAVARERLARLSEEIPSYRPQLPSVSYDRAARSMSRAGVLGLDGRTAPPAGFASTPAQVASERFGALPSRPLDVASRRVASAVDDPRMRSFTQQGIEVSRPIAPAGGYAVARAPVMSVGRPPSLMDNVTLKDWGASLPPGADPRLAGLSVYSPEGLAGRIGESRTLYGDMRGPAGPVPGLTQDDIDAVMNARAFGPDPAETAARIAAYNDPTNTAAAQEAGRMKAARRANEALSSYTTAATPRAPSIREQAAAANQGVPATISSMLSGMDRLATRAAPKAPVQGAAVAPTFGNDPSVTKADRLGPQTPMRDYRWTGGLLPGQSMPPSPAYTYDKVLPTRVARDLQSITPAQPEAPAPGPTPTYVPEPVQPPGVRQLNNLARPQPTIAAPASSMPAARRDMRNVFPPAPLSPPAATRLDMLGPALKQAILGGLVGGLPGAAIGLAGGLLGRPGGLLGGLGPGFDAAIPSYDRFSTGSGLGGMLSAMGGPRGATGYSLSNPGMSYTSLGGNLGGLRRSDKYGWTEHVAPDGSVTGTNYDNGGGGLLGGLSRGLGSLFGGSDTSNDKAGKSKGKGSGGKHSGGGLY